MQQLARPRLTPTAAVTPQLSLADTAQRDQRLFFFFHRLTQVATTYEVNLYALRNSLTSRPVHEEITTVESESLGKVGFLFICM